MTEQNKALVRRFYEEIDKGNIEAMDDLTINAPVTPEPASLLLFGTGMVACAARLRKRRRK